MADASTVIAPVIGAAVINGISAFRGDGNSLHPADATKVFIANAGVLASLVAVGQFVDWQLAGMIALIYFLGTLLVNGAPIINWFSELVGGN